MTMQPPPSLQIKPASEARVIRAFGDEATFHLSGAETGGRCTMFTLVTPPGGGPPPHYHEREDEWFLVQEGRAEFLKDGEWFEVAPGSAVFAPRGVTHTFRNAGEGPLRMLIQTSPAGFEEFFARCAEEFARPGAPNPDRLSAIGVAHGIHMVLG